MPKHLTFSPAFLDLCKAIDAAEVAQNNYKAALDAAHAARLVSLDAEKALRAAQMASVYERSVLTPARDGVIIDVVSE